MRPSSKFFHFPLFGSEIERFDSVILIFIHRIFNEDSFTIHYDNGKRNSLDKIGFIISEFCDFYSQFVVLYRKRFWSSILWWTYKLGTASAMLHDSVIYIENTFKVRICVCVQVHAIAMCAYLNSFKCLTVQLNLLFLLWFFVDSTTDQNRCHNWWENQWHRIQSAKMRPFYGNHILLLLTVVLALF